MAKGGKDSKPAGAAGAGKAKGKGKPKDEDTASSAASGKAGGKLKPATKINVRHILCEKQSQKDAAVERLRNGDKFDDVAREVSIDKARQGGSLGWKNRGELLPDFESVAYDLEPSTTTNPKWAEVKTSEGYHVVMVEGRK